MKNQFTAKYGKNKNELYTTAIWNKTGKHVHLDKYHKHGNYYDITTIEGNKFRAFKDELMDFCL
jgi:hypothetical protein